jgi:uncharacterized membrane protein
MNDTNLVILAACVAAAMAFLVRAGAGPSLRTALRTTAVVALGWDLAYSANRPLSPSMLTWRVWAMLALSALAVGSAWWLHLRERSMERPPAARADKVNVWIAAAFAVLLILGDSPKRYGFALLLLAGAVILALNRPRYE